MQHKVRVLVTRIHSCNRQDPRSEQTPPRSPHTRATHAHTRRQLSRESGEQGSQGFLSKALDVVADVVTDTVYEIKNAELVTVLASKDDELFHFWFSAAMLFEREAPLVRRKWHLDGLKDAKHKKFDAHFRVELSFSKATPSAPRTSRAASLSVAGEL